MNTKVYLSTALLLVSKFAIAEQIEIPNKFVAGAKAKASEVNENFAVLARESNAQDTRIGNSEDLLENIVSQSNAQDIRIGNSEELLENIVLESNSQDVRISALEAASKKEQLICYADRTYMFNGFLPIECISSSSTSIVSFSTVHDIYAAGWQAKSIGGDSVVVILFEK